MKTKDQQFSRGQIAKYTNIKAETIRYYETCGLLHSPARSAGGHRIYTEDHAKRLTFIRRSRELGFTVNQIIGLIELSEEHHKSCSRVRDVTATHLAEVKGKIKDLKKMERTLNQMVSQCDETSSPECPIIERLFC
jgi:MerR family mercuric resistance operon transcriptional regulator